MKHRHGAYGHVEIVSSSTVQKVMELVDDDSRLIHNNVREVLLYLGGISAHSRISIGGRFCSVTIPRHDRTLSSYARRLSIMERLAVFPHVARDLCCELSKLHDQGYVHNDVKPDNVMVNAPLGACPTCHIIDFGSCTMIGRSISQGHTCSTFPYAAPECFLGSGDTTPSRDAYMLGTTLLTFLNGGNLPPALMEAVAGCSATSNMDVAMQYWGQIHYGTDKLDASRLVNTVRSRTQGGSHSAWAVVHGLMHREASSRHRLPWQASKLPCGFDVFEDVPKDPFRYSIRDVHRCAQHVFGRDVPWPSSNNIIGRVVMLAHHLLSQYLQIEPVSSLDDLIEASVLLSMSLLVEHDLTCSSDTLVSVLRMLEAYSTSVKGVDFCSMDWRLVRHYGSNYSSIDFSLLMDVIDGSDGVDALSMVRSYHHEQLERASK